MKAGVIIRGLTGDHLIEHVGQGRWSIIHEPSGREIASVDGATTREARGNAEFAIGFLAAEELEAQRAMLIEAQSFTPARTDAEVERDRERAKAELAGAPRGGSRKDGPLLEGPQDRSDIPGWSESLRAKRPYYEPQDDPVSEARDSPRIIREIAEMCDRIGTAREEDPLWDDPETLMRKMGEAQLVTGGKHPRIRTRGWQVLSALAAMAVREIEDREPSDSEIATVNPWVRENR